MIKSNRPDFPDILETRRSVFTRQSAPSQEHLETLKSKEPCKPAKPPMTKKRVCGHLKVGSDNDTVSSVDDPQPGSSKDAGTRRSFVQENENTSSHKGKGKAKAAPVNKPSSEDSENEDVETSSVVTFDDMSTVSIPTSTRSETAGVTSETAGVTSETAGVTDGTASTETQDSHPRYARPKVATVRRYCEKLVSGYSKCKICEVRFGPRTSSSTITRHFVSKHPSAWEEMIQQRADSFFH